MRLRPVTNATPKQVAFLVQHNGYSVAEAKRLDSRAASAYISATIRSWKATNCPVSVNATDKALADKAKIEKAKLSISQKYVQ